MRLLVSAPLHSYVTGGTSDTRTRDIVIRDVVADQNHRQGISVISAVGLLVENSTFSGTNGTAPMAGQSFLLLYNSNTEVHRVNLYL